MLRRPKEFSLLSVTMLGIAASMPIQVFFFYEDTQMGFVMNGMGLTPLNWAVMGTALLSALFAHQASRFLLFSLAMFLGATAWNNWLVAEVEMNYSSLAAWVGLGLAACLPLVLLREPARRVLMNPRLRWWRTPERIRVPVQAVVYPVLGGEILSKTFDLSEGGAFVAMPLGSLKSTHTDPQARAIAVGNHCALRLRLDQLNVLNCSARIVRKAKAAGAYPDGFALEFVNLNPEQRRQIRTFIDHAPQPQAMAA